MNFEIARALYFNLKCTNVYLELFISINLDGYWVVLLNFVEVDLMRCLPRKL